MVAVESTGFLAMTGGSARRSRIVRAASRAAKQEWGRRALKAGTEGVKKGDGGIQPQSSDVGAKRVGQRCKDLAVSCSAAVPEGLNPLRPLSPVRHRTAATHDAPRDRDE